MKNNSAIKILFIEDTEADLEMALRELRKSGLEFSHRCVDNGDDLIKVFGEFDPDIVVSDYSLPAFDGINALRITKKLSPFIPFIVLTGPQNEEIAVSCMKAGATDYLIKGRIARLPFAIADAIKASETRKEKDRAYDLLKENEEKLRMFSNNASDVLWVFNVEKMRIEYVSNSFERLCGYTIDEAPELSIDMFIASESLQGVLAMIATQKEAFERGEGKTAPRTIKVENLKKDGTTVWTEVVIRYTKNAREELVIIGVSRDITERIKFENAILEAKNKAEEANCAKTRFLNKVSHELRTPMNGIMGFAQLVACSKIDDEQRECIDLLMSSSKRLMGIIEDMLDFTKLELSAVDLDDCCFDIVETIENSVGEVTEQIKMKKLEISTHFGSLVARSVRGDAKKFKRVIDVVISNSIKFTHEGKIIIHVRELDPIDGIVKVVVAVSDTGIGISPGQTDEIFEIFHQLDDSSTRRYGGTGLGLPIARKLLEMMDGTISVKSESGSGSCFTITVPFVIDGAKAADSKKHEKLVIGARRILKVLVAEDDPLNLHLVKMMLAKLGCDSISARDGFEAVKLYKSQEFDIILMDMQMPGMDGFEAVRRIREIEKNTGKRTPIVAVSAFLTSDDKCKIVAAGMDGFIQKPIETFRSFADSLEGYTREVE